MINTFLINNEDVYLTWGIVFEKGVFSELLKFPKRKETLSHVWLDQHGTERDDTPYFESMEYTLRMMLIADDEDDFWIKYSSFYDFILTSGYFTFTSVQLNKDFTLLYRSTNDFKNVTPIKSGNKVKAIFSITFINDFTGVNEGGGVGRPARPTNGIVDDNANTFTVTASVGITGTAHEYRNTAVSSTWLSVTSDMVNAESITIPVGNINAEIGTIQVRVAANGTTPASLILSNQTAFTIASIGSSTFPITFPTTLI